MEDVIWLAPVLAAVVLALLLWLWREPRKAPRIADKSERPPPEIVVPTCGECGAIVWENRTHGNTFCENGHKDPKIVMKPIEGFGL